MRKFLNKLLPIILLILLLGATYYYREELLLFYNDITDNDTNKPTEIVKNEYYRDYNFLYVKNIENFYPGNKVDLLNIYYTIINSGMESFTFYCDESIYETCLQDAIDIANNQVVLSNINNFIHPFNSFKKIETEYDTLGKITIKIIKSYTKDEITTINNKINTVMNTLIEDSDTETEKIKKIHDYIISNTKYDKARSEQNIIEFKSDIAYGPLIEGIGVCGGYTDSMMLFLERMNIKSIKISSSNHVWNYVYLNNRWVHLDLTWDDPVTSNNTDIIEYNYFLVSDISKLDVTQHNYDKSVYGEK